MFSYFNAFLKYQRHVQDEIILPNSPKIKPHQVTSEYLNHSSSKLSCTESNQNKSESSTGQVEGKETSGW